MPLCFSFPPPPIQSIPDYCGVMSPRCTLSKDKPHCMAARDMSFACGNAPQMPYASYCNTTSVQKDQFNSIQPNLLLQSEDLVHSWDCFTYHPEIPQITINPVLKLFSCGQIQTANLLLIFGSKIVLDTSLPTLCIS